MKFSNLNSVLNSSFFYVRQIPSSKGILFKYLFQGTSKYIVFVSSAKSSITDNLALCKLYVRNKNLILQEYPLYNQKYDYINPNMYNILKNNRPKKEIIILKNVKGIKIAYYKGKDKYDILDGDIPQEIDLQITLENSKTILFIFHIESNFYNKNLYSQHLYQIQKNGL